MGIAPIATDNRRWVSCRKGFFLPVRVLSRLFRRLFLQYLQAVYEKGQLQFEGTISCYQQPAAFTELINRASQFQWVVYAKRPFGGPAQVLDYLGQYTHRVAISNHRLESIDNGTITFRWRDYKDNSKVKHLQLNADEFIRRFLLHILPDGFQRIRYFGFLSNRNRTDKLLLCRKLLSVKTTQEEKDKQLKTDWKERYEQLTGKSLDNCPVCGKGRMVMIAIHNPQYLQVHMIKNDSS